MDYEGNIIRWETDLVENGEVSVLTKNLSAEEIGALKIATAPGSKQGIHKAIEMLAQIKPIGKSEAKQETVISYLVHDLYQEGISDFVVGKLCGEYRRSTDSPFFPQYGEFMDSAKRQMDIYRKALISAI